MRVLITGATGFIGSHVARLLVREGHTAVGYDLMPTPERIKDLADQVPIAQGDVCDLDVLLSTVKRHSITHIFHLAYYLPEAAIAEHPTKAIRVNSEGTNNVFEAARVLGVKRVVYASTDAVCPLGPEEDDPVKPTTLYGHMKYSNEVMGRHYSRHFGLDTIGLRFGVNYGPGGRRVAGEVRRKYTSAFLHEILENMMLGRTTRVDLHPETSFCWQYVKDSALCMVLALSTGPTKRKVFDVPGDRKPFKYLTDIIERLVPGSKAVYQRADDKDSGLIVLKPAFEIDPKIVNEEFGFEPQYTLNAGLAEMAEEVQKAPEIYDVAATAGSP